LGGVYFFLFFSFFFPLFPGFSPPTGWGGGGGGGGDTSQLLFVIVSSTGSKNCAIFTKTLRIIASLCYPFCQFFYLTQRLWCVSSIVYGVVPSYLVKGIIQGVDEYFLGAFAKLRETTSSCVVSLRPSVRMEQLGSHWTDFHEIWLYFESLLGKFKFR